MTRRAIKEYSPFAFRSDFAALEKDETATVAVSADELAQLLAEARSEGMAAAHEDHETGLSTDMQAATSKLNQALADLVALAGHLEACEYDLEKSETARDLINAAAQRIIDGQGDLFHAND